MDWRFRSACRDKDPELFFPTGTSGPALLQIAEAKTVCRRCPVNAECLNWALASGQDAGVWGGMSEDERRAVKRRAARRQPKRPPSAYDPLTVEHLVAGHRMPGASDRDRAEAAVRLHQQDWDCVQIGDRVGVSDDMAARWIRRHKAGQPLVQTRGVA